MDKNSKSIKFPGNFFHMKMKHFTVDDKNERQDKQKYKSLWLERRGNNEKKQDMEWLWKLNIERVLKIKLLVPAFFKIWKLHT